MKCSKCGFTSFDYLSECKKCGVDLSGIRESFGFQGIKPSMPFFLGSLLKGYVKPPIDEEKHPDELSGPLADLGEVGASVVGEFDDFQAEAPECVAEVTSEQDTEIEDFSILDISDEELDLLLDSPESRPGQSRIVASEQAEEVKGASAESFVEADAQSAPKMSAPEGYEEVEVTDENLVIDLSEQDLEAILTELETGSSKSEKDAQVAG